MEKTKILNKIEEIIENINHYKSKKDLIRLISKLDNIIYKNKRDFFLDTVKKFKDNIATSDFTEEELNLLEKSLYGFILRNAKSYNKKIESNDYTIYEFDNSYTIYANNNVNIDSFLENKFKGLQVTQIKLDNVQWNDIRNITNDDYKSAKTIKLTISKTPVCWL